MDIRDLNSDPQAWVASTLPTKTPAAPLLISSCWTGKMAQWVEAIAGKPEDLIGSPGLLLVVL